MPPDFHTVPICATNISWSTQVRSASPAPAPWGGEFYTVRFEKLPIDAATEYGFTCTCPGFRYRGDCRHIRENRDQRCGWNGALVFAAAADGGSCPDCGGPIVLMKVSA